MPAFTSPCLVSHHVSPGRPGCRTSPGSLPAPVSRFAAVAILARVAAAGGLLLLAPPGLLLAEERPHADGGLARPAAAGDEVAFLRLVRDDAGRPLAFETSVVSYGPAPPRAAALERGGREMPLQVDLVSAVHLGGRDYYDTLNRLFTGYDAVLYELVAPPNATVPKPGRRPGGMIGSAQVGLTQVLGLEFQLERIDYTADNFVHADLSPKEFAAAMARRGESWWSIFTKLMREGMNRAEQGKPPRGAELGVTEMFGLLFGSGPDRQIRLRRLMAEQFSEMDTLTAAFGGEEGSTLITDRNAAALAVLRQRITVGDRRIAIFYGAAHMDDFDRRLREDFGLEPQPRETVWLEAWDLREPAVAGAR